MKKNSDKGQGLSLILLIVLFTIILYGVHTYIMSYFFGDLILFFPLWHIYVFLSVITIIFYLVINYRFNRGQKNVFTLFMLGTFLKMLLAIIFLLPLLMSDFPNKQPDIINFFIAYFAYLFLEVFSLNKLLQKA